MKTSIRQPFAGGLAALAIAVLTAGSALGQVQFERITTGEVVTDAGTSYGVSWGDFDDDGWVDLFIANSYGEPNCLYRNVSRSELARSGALGRFLTRLTGRMLLRLVCDTAAVRWRSLLLLSN